MKKPTKPYKTYPLFAHANGHWCKKINGRNQYFGSWRHGITADAAVAEYNEVRDALHRGIDPPQYTSACTVSKTGVSSWWRLRCEPGCSDAASKPPRRLWDQRQQARPQNPRNCAPTPGQVKVAGVVAGVEASSRPHHHNI